MFKRLMIIWGAMLLWPLSPSSASVRFPFSGDLDFRQYQHSLNIHLGPGKPIVLDLRRKDPTHWQMLVTAEDVMTPFFDISTLIQGEVESAPLPQSGVAWKGKITARNTLVNRRPVDDCSGQFEIRDQQLVLHYFSTGQVTVRGRVALVPPFTMDLKVDLFAVEMKDLIAFFAPREHVAAQGSVSGFVILTGPWSRLMLKGQLSSFNGRIEELAFRSLVLNAEGPAPKIVLTDSHIAQDDGLTYTISGVVDLGDREHFDKQIAALAFAPWVTDEGSDRVWTLKRLQSVPGGATTEIKYLLRGNDDDHLQMDGEDDLFGIERRIDF